MENNTIFFLHSLVTSFESIAENLVAQEDFVSLEVVGEDITIKAERVCLELL